jgi:hypothetical protein
MSYMPSYIAIYLALIVTSASVPPVRTAVADDVPVEYSAMVNEPRTQETDAVGNHVLITVPNGRTTTYERDAITMGEMAAAARAASADAHAAKTEQLMLLALIFSSVAVVASAVSIAASAALLRRDR